MIAQKETLFLFVFLQVYEDLNALNRNEHLWDELDFTPDLLTQHQHLISVMHCHALHTHSQVTQVI